MGRLSSYITRQIAVGTVFVTVALLCIVWLLQSLRFLTLIVSEGASVLSFLRLTSLLLPNVLVTVLPIALFAVVVFAYNRMNNDRELAVIKAAGVGPFGIARPAMVISWVFAIFLFWMTMSVVPAAMQSFRELQWSLRNDFSRILLQEGEFTQAVAGITVYVRSRTSDGQLLDIMVHDERIPKEPTTFIAERGALVNGPQGPQLLMINGSRTSTVQDSGRLSLLYFSNYSLDIPAGQGPTDRDRSTDELSWQDLMAAQTLMPTANTPAALKIAQERVNLARAELHHRLSLPLAAPSLALVAMVIILTGPFSRRGQAWRVITAALVLFALEAAMVDSQSLASRVPALVLLQYAISVLPGLISAGVLFRPDIAGLFDRRRFPALPSASTRP